MLLNGEETDVTEFDVNDIKIIRDGKKTRDEEEYSESELKAIQD